MLGFFAGLFAGLIGVEEEEDLFTKILEEIETKIRLGNLRVLDNEIKDQSEGSCEWDMGPGHSPNRVYEVGVLTVLVKNRRRLPGPRCIAVEYPSTW